MLLLFFSFILAYTITAMQANFVLCLFPSSDNRRCLPSCGRCLRRFFHRFCFCFVVFIWCVSFTSTIPLLYTIDANEKIPKPVYCPGTKEISYLDEWFDRNRIIQTVICNLIPLVICILLTIIAVSKLFYDFLLYCYARLKKSPCFPFRNQSSTTNLPIQSCRDWFPMSFLRVILVLSSCLLACIYPIVMRFYLIYFSVIIPLIFAVFNYSLILTQTPMVIENQSNVSPAPITIQENKIAQTNDSSGEQIELQAPLVTNIPVKHDESSASACSTPHQHRRQSLKKLKQNYFANHLYENTRSASMK